MKKIVAFVVCSLILVSCANAHLFRRARVQYVVVDPCGCVEMHVDEARGTVTAKKIEIERKIEIKRERRSVLPDKPIIQDFPPVINDLPAEELKPEEVKEQQSILVLSGDFPVTK